MEVSSTSQSVSFTRPDWETLEPHPASELFPPIEGKDFASLCQSIRDHGLREPIWLHEGRILDGRNRLAACRKCGVEPSFREYAGDDPIGFAVDLNMERRHLNESQRAL